MAPEKVPCFRIRLSQPRPESPMDESFDYHPVADTLDDEAAVVCFGSNLAVVVTLLESAPDIFQT